MALRDNKAHQIVFLRAKIFFKPHIPIHKVCRAQACIFIAMDEWYFMWFSD